MRVPLFDILTRRHQPVQPASPHVSLPPLTIHSSDPLLVAHSIRYEQTIGDVKQAVAQKLGVPIDKQQYFWHRRELTAADESKTLLEMNMHTGFQLRGYDLVRP